MFDIYYSQAIEDKNVFDGHSKSSKSSKTTPLTESVDNSASDSDKGKETNISASDDLDGRAKTNHLEEEEEMSSSPKVPPTDDDLYLNETTNPIMAAIAKIAAGHSSDEVGSPVGRFTDFTVQSSPIIKSVLDKIGSSQKNTAEDVVVHSTPEPKNMDRNVPQEFHNYVRGDSVKKNLNIKFDSIDKQDEEASSIPPGLISDGLSQGTLSRSLSPIQSADKSSPVASLKTPYLDNDLSNSNGDANNDVELSSKCCQLNYVLS